MSAESLIDWITEVEPTLLQEDSIPLFNQVPPFPWETFTKIMAKNFGLSELQIRLTHGTWLNPAEIKKVTEGFHIQGVTVNAFTDPLYWIISKKDLHTLISATLQLPNTPIVFTDIETDLGFQSFLMCQTLHAIESLAWIPNLSLQLSQDASIDEEPFFCYEIEINLADISIKTKLLLSASFKRQWQLTCQQKTPFISSAMAEKIKLSVGVAIGTTHLSYPEWQQIQINDLVLLDECSWDPENKKNRVHLIIGSKTLYRGRLKANTIKLIGPPIDYEVNKMIQEIEPPQKTEATSAIPPLGSGSPPKAPTPPTEPASKTPPTKPNQPLSEKTETTISSPSKAPPSELSSEEEEEDESLSEIETHPPIDVSEIIDLNSTELTIQVILGELKLSLAQISAMEPGNLLELGLRPEDGVELCIENQCIAKGELVKIGDLIGVRITKKS